MDDGKNLALGPVDLIDQAIGGLKYLLGSAPLPSSTERPESENGSSCPTWAWSRSIVLVAYGGELSATWRPRLSCRRVFSTNE